MADSAYSKIEAKAKMENSLNSIFNSEPVKRLFSQPNIIIKAVPNNRSSKFLKINGNSSPLDKKNGINGEFHILNHPELSIHIINKPTKEKNNKDYLLPSKYNGKSEIELVPIENSVKTCGHFEPCENLICDVIIHKYEDDTGSSPLIAYSIDDDEIDAPIFKHCNNTNCDTLNIDHNRCRRGLIKLNRCDDVNICDICEKKFKTRKARYCHVKCKRKNIYQHNTLDARQIFRLRMREREIQINEETRLRQSSKYLDPKNGLNRAIEAIRNNDELIVIPKMFIPQQNEQKTKRNSIIHFNNKIPKYKNYFYNSINKENIKDSSSYHKSLSSNKISDEFKKMNSKFDSHNPSSSKQIKLTDHLNGATVNILDAKVQNNYSDYDSDLQDQAKFMNNFDLQCNKKINLRLPQQQKTNSVKDQSNKFNTNLIQQNLNVNHWIKANQTNSTPEPIMAPFKLVPIAELKSEPSLLHQTQGVPRFCVVPDTSNMKIKIPNKTESSKILKAAAETQKTDLRKKILQCQKKYPKILPKLSLKKPLPNLHQISPTLSKPVRTINIKLGKIIKNSKKKLKQKSRTRKKLIKKQKKFVCTHCPKRFTSMDYCKLHVAKHENNLDFYCRLCEKPFMNKAVINKHIENDHKVGEVRCEICKLICSSNENLINHMKNPDIEIDLECFDNCNERFKTCRSLLNHMKETHGFLVCKSCNNQIPKIIIKTHLMLEHSVSKTKSENDFEKFCYPKTEKIPEKNLSLDAKNKEKISISPIVNNTINENKNDQVVFAKRSSRISAKHLEDDAFHCAICERKFESEKRYEIHLASNPKKFTPCPDCGKKFHRKSDYTEHSKTCVENKLVQDKISEEKTSKKSSVLSDVGKKENKNIKKKEKLIQQKENGKDCIKKQDYSMKISIQNDIDIMKILNGVKEDCLDSLPIFDDENLSKNIGEKINEKSLANDKLELSTVYQDHNYQVMQ